MDKQLKKHCPVCNSTKAMTYWAMPGYKLARCEDCGMVWDYIPSENVLAQYNKSYFVNENPKGGYANYFEGMRINSRTFTERLKRIESRLGKKGKLLDVGCALGDCLVEAKKLGWKKAEGVEVADYAYKFAKERGLNIHKGTLDDNKFPPNTFDVVTYQDVIEHIPDPVSELKKVKRILKPKGIVFLVTPDIGGLWHRILGRLWYHHKPGEHIMYFSQKSLAMALKKAGFENIETRRTYHIFSTEYVLNRLRYYSPFVFETLLKVISRTPIKNYSFKAYSGEIEAWGQK